MNMGMNIHFWISTFVLISSESNFITPLFVSHLSKSVFVILSPTKSVRGHSLFGGKHPLLVFVPVYS